MKCDNNIVLDKIQEDIMEIKINLADHMARTKASEDRLTMVENRFFDNEQKQYDRYDQMDKSNKAFTYKVLVGFVLAGFLPFLLKILGVVGG
jgi:hypothetical protein